MTPLLWWGKSQIQFKTLCAQAALRSPPRQCAGEVHELVAQYIYSAYCTCVCGRASNVGPACCRWEGAMVPEYVTVERLLHQAAAVALDSFRLPEASVVAFLKGELRVGDVARTWRTEVRRSMPRPTVEHEQLQTALLDCLRQSSWQQFWHCCVAWPGPCSSRCRYIRVQANTAMPSCLCCSSCMGFSFTRACSAQSTGPHHCQGPSMPVVQGFCLCHSEVHAWQSACG